MTVKEMRREAGMTQKEFGKFLGGVPLKSIQNWEYNRTQCPNYILHLFEYKLVNEGKIKKAGE